jgi:hypothetical protein
MDSSFERDIKNLLVNAPKQATIDELLEFVSDSVNVPDEFTREAADIRLKAVIRRQLKTLLGPDGLAMFESIERPTADGGTERVYAQLTLFDKNDYRRVIDYYTERGSYFARKANSLTKRCNKQHQTQLPLPFPRFDEGEGAVA